MLNIGKLHLNFTNNLNYRCTDLFGERGFLEKLFENKFLRGNHIFLQLAL